MSIEEAHDVIAAQCNDWCDDTEEQYEDCGD